MVLKLSLPDDRFVWALSHPIGKGYIHQHDGKGYQDCKLIISQADVQPVEVKLDDYPKWAQSMIRTSIGLGHLINTGDSLYTVKKETKAEVKAEVKTEIKEVVAEASEPVEKQIRKKRQTRQKKDK